MNQQFDLLRNRRLSLTMQVRQMLASIEESGKELKGQDRARMEALVSEIALIEQQMDEEREGAGTAASKDEGTNSGIAGHLPILSTAQRKLVKALRSLGRANEDLRHREWLKLYKHYLTEKKPPAPPTKPNEIPSPIYSFRTTIPLRATNEAIDVLKHLERDGHDVALVFPPSAHASVDQTVTLVDASGSSKSLGRMEKESEANPRLKNIAHQGLWIRKGSDGDRIDFVVRTPATETSIRSPRTKRQGDLSVRLHSTSEKHGSGGDR